MIGSSILPCLSNVSALSTQNFITKHKLDEESQTCAVIGQDRECFRLVLLLQSQKLQLSKSELKREKGCERNVRVQRQTNEIYTNNK